MNLSYIPIFYGITHINTNTRIFTLDSKKGRSAPKQPKNKQQSYFKIDPNAVEFNLEDYPEIKSSGQAIRKLNELMAASNLLPIYNEKPTRHYPAHHYKRKIKQRRGFQQSEARRDAYLERHTSIHPNNNIKSVQDKHLPDVLEAIDMYDAWVNSKKVNSHGGLTFFSDTSDE